ncbi:MAG: peroxidase family protein [Pseudomonadota bacterium]
MTALVALPWVSWPVGAADEGAPPEPAVSPAFGIKHDKHRGRRGKPAVNESPFRSIDGSGNNFADPQMGSAFSQLRRRIPAQYADGISELAGPFRPSARAVSNGMAAQAEDLPNPLRASDYLWQWGQFLDHDIDLTDGTDPPEPANILVPVGDPWFDPDGTGTQEIALNRSIYDPDSGVTTARQQLNEITAWIDASNVYGSDPVRAAALRTNDGSGRLKTSAGNLLPFNLEGLPNAGGEGTDLFLAGDVRANEQVGLTAMHTLFVREHNRLAENIAADNPDLSGEEIYQWARATVAAQIQVITYYEYLPALLGKRALKRYKGYDPTVDAGIANIFSGAAFRLGHSQLSSQLLRLDRDLDSIDEGPLALRDAFFSPSRIIVEGGIEPLLRGLAHQQAQRIDPYVVDEVRNFLFGPPGAGGFDLAALNVQRGRDHGLPSYVEARRALGLSVPANFADITSDPEIRARLVATYASVEDIDLFTGGLAEEPLHQGHLGPLFAEIVAEQFEALRDGDRYWYKRNFDSYAAYVIKETRLSDIIRRNTSIDDEIPDDVFHLPPRHGDGKKKKK